MLEPRPPPSWEPRSTKHMIAVGGWSATQVGWDRLLLNKTVEYWPLDEATLICGFSLSIQYIFPLNQSTARLITVPFADKIFLQESFPDSLSLSSLISPLPNSER